MSQSESTSYLKLKAKLEEIFQLDRSDLDFGLYRIMNQKRGEITAFLDDDLLPQVKSILGDAAPADGSSAQKELEQLKFTLHEAGMDYNASPKVQELEAKVNTAPDLTKLENEIYSDLYNFFRRYYSDGDFMSLRRYKEGVYAMPYEGEEVKLHWANHDQYYIKTTENLTNYTFKSTGKDGKPKKIRFEIVSADTEKNNNKAAEGKERRFLLHTKNPLTVVKDEMILRFEFRADTEKRKQEKINEETYQALADRAELTAFDLKELAPTEKKKERTLIEKHLTDFTAKNSFDYFIHKDLGKFLRRELDFYIKNEIMHLDDIENADAPSVESYLTKIKALRKVAGKVITMLAQLEDYQKKLWLKKKFVLESHYCITLDHIIQHHEGKDAAEILAIIASNTAQLEAWVDLFKIDQLEGYSSPLTIEFLQANDKLQVDTKFYDTAFKYRLLSGFDDLDEQTDGLMINSENFQALNLMQERYKEKVKCIYIDPPYNTEKDREKGNFVYKDSYDTSSWLSMMSEKISFSRNLLSQKGIFSCHIDENEHLTLEHLIQNHFGEDHDMGKLIWDKRNPKGAPKGIAMQHEYVHFSCKNKDELSLVNFFVRDKVNAEKMLKKASDLIKKAGGVTECVRIDFKKWLKTQDLSGGEEAYKFIDERGDVYQPVSMAAPDKPETRSHKPLIHPVTKKQCPVPQKGWRFTYETMNNMQERFVFGKDENTQPRQKYLLKEQTLESMASLYYMGGSDEELAKDIGYKFDNPKPVKASQYFLKASARALNSVVLDYFAGSGTTGHAVINLNREDQGKRKYILVEMGTYFNSVTKPRVQKVAYSNKWKDGSPEAKKGSLNGVSHVMKYMALEQYEDTLDNLVVEKNEQQASLLAQNPQLKEDYLLSYMMEFESKESPSLLNLESFANPFDYTLRITRDDDTQLVKVDLVETFNYLLGLVVKTIDLDSKAGILTVTGVNSHGEQCLILWRDASKVNSEELDTWFTRRYSSKDYEFDAIYVNGDNHIENLKTNDDRWKVRLTEVEFQRLMFAENG